MTDADTPAAVPEGRTLDELQPICELLCLCTRPGPLEPHGDRIRELLATCDRDRFVRAAIHRHRVPALVAETLEKLRRTAGGSRGPVPSAVLEPIREASREIALRNLVRTGDLLGILDRLEEAGVPAIPFKGPVLAKQVYDDVGRRQFADLDLMVPRDRLAAADDTLRDADFEPLREPGSAERRIQKRSGGHLNFREGGTRVELHAQGEPAGLAAPVTYEWLAERTIDVELSGGAVPGLDPEATLVLLCVHGGKHRWERLKWLCDVAHLLETAPLDWARVRREAERLGRCRALHQGLLLAADLFDATVPSGPLSTAVQDETVTALATSTARRSLIEGEEARGPVRKQLYTVRLLDRRRERAAYARRFLFEPRAAEGRAVPLPPWLDGVYTALRPVRLAYAAIRLYGGR